MRLWGWTGAIALLAGGLFASGAFAPSVQAQVVAAQSRCNFNVAGQLEQQVRADDRRSPGSGLDALDDRQEDLDSILQQAQIESDILHNVCSDQELPPVQDQLAGVIAWAYALEADIAPRRYALLHCPQTAAEASLALVASAWYALSTTLVNNMDPQGTPLPPSPLVKEVMPKVQARAAALHLPLPPPDQATQYWRDTLNSSVAVCAPATP
jgi:hypothetical protein